MTALAFKRLEHLDVRGFVIAPADLRTFLESHVHTFRELRVLDGFFASDVTDVAEWAGKRLALKGVQLDKGVKVLGPPVADGKRSEIVRREGMPSSSCHVDPGDKLERLFLGERPNRMKRVPLHPTGGGDWWDEELAAHPSGGDDRWREELPLSSSDDEEGPRDEVVAESLDLEPHGPAEEGFSVFRV